MDVTDASSFIETLNPQCPDMNIDDNGHGIIHYSIDDKNKTKK